MLHVLVYLIFKKYDSLLYYKFNSTPLLEDSPLRSELVKKVKEIPGMNKPKGNYSSNMSLLSDFTYYTFLGTLNPD